MILYAVEIYNYQNVKEWLTVNIWRTREKAEKGMKQYETNWSNHSAKEEIPSYRITKIDTDIDSDCIYDIVENNINK